MIPNIAYIGTYKCPVLTRPSKSIDGLCRSKFLIVRQKSPLTATKDSMPPDVVYAHISIYIIAMTVIITGTIITERMAIFKINQSLPPRKQSVP